jgi:hypothetical protein
MGRSESVNSEVLAAYGRAMREVQRLERTLWQLSICHHVVIRLKKKETIEEDEVENAFASFDGKTLGGKVKKYRDELVEIGFPSLSMPGSARLKDALAVRNFLAHHYFNRHPADDFASIPDCIKALPGDHRFAGDYLDNIMEPHPVAMAELLYARDLFAAVDREIGDWMAKVLDALGIRP